VRTAAALDVRKAFVDPADWLAVCIGKIRPTALMPFPLI
jgi:hypothetical protein